MKGLGIGSTSGLKQITLDQVALWNFGDFFVPFGFPKMIVVDADELFSGMLKKTFQ